MIFAILYAVAEADGIHDYCDMLQADDWQEALDRAQELGARVCGAVGAVVCGEATERLPEPPDCPPWLRGHSAMVRT